MFYQHHVFFCVNQRESDSPRPSCANCGAQHLLAYVKKRIQHLGLSGPGKLRISKAGCLGRCEEGPAVVIYPEGIWYTYVDESDLDEIIDSHLLGGKVVERLLLKSEKV